MSEELPNWFEFVKPNFESHVSHDELVALQIGVYKGDATRWLLDNRNVKRIVDVDTWQGSQENEGMDFSLVEKVYDERFALESRVEKFKGTSDEYFIKRSPQETFTFIYIDGDHSALQTALDGINAWRALQVGGVMAFDDYQWPVSPGTPDHPKDGVDCVLQLFSGRYIVLANNYQVWIRKVDK